MSPDCPSTRSEISGSCSASRSRAAYRAGRSRSSSGSTTVARLGRANSSATPAAPAPNPSPMRAASRPRSTTTWPAAASVTVSRPPRWNLRSPVTRAGSPRPRSSRSRTCSVPERSSATTSLPPASSRSILNTRPAAGPSGDGSRLGSSSGSAWRSSATPSPFRADPKSTGTSGSSRSRTSSSTNSGSAPARSTLLTNTTVAMPSRCRARISTSVCACTPSTAETTSTAPSSRLRARSTSAMKSEWPGVSTRLTVVPSTSKDTTAARMVMPRRRSSAIVSVWVEPASTLPGSASTPASTSRRSVRVVLPASTCARTPRVSVRNLHILGLVDGWGRESSSHRLLLWFGSLGRPMAPRRGRYGQGVFGVVPCGSGVFERV